MIKGIEHVAIFAKDTKQLTDWYVKVFGFKKVYDNGKGTYFLMAQDGAMIEFCPAAEQGGISGERVSGIRHLAIAVRDFEKEAKRIMDEKVEAITAPTTSPAGVSTFFFRDPEGNVLHLIQRKEPIV